MGRLIQRIRYGRKVRRGLAGRAADERYGGYGNSFVYNGDTVFPGNFLSHLHQVFGGMGDFTVDFLIYTG